MKRTIAPQILTSEAGLGNFNSAWDGGGEGGGTACVVTEGLGAGVDPALGWVADVGVTNEEFPSLQGKWAIERQQHEVAVEVLDGSPLAGSEGK